MLIRDAFAAPAAAAQPGILESFLPMIIIFVLFFFMIIRPQMKRAKQLREMLGNLQKGDEVVIAGGVMGRIEQVEEEVLRVAVAREVSLQVQRGAVQSVLPKGTVKLS